MKNFFAKLYLLLFVLAFICGEVVRMSPLGGVNITPLDIIVGVGGIWGIWEVLRNKLFKKSLFKSIILFWAFGFVSLMISLFWLPTNFVVSSLYGLRWLIYSLTFFFFATRNTKYKKLLNKCMVVIVISSIVIGYMQYFLYPNLANISYLGWDDHLGRMFGSFLDPNFAGCIYSLFFFYMLGREEKLGRLGRLGVLGILGALLLAIILTFSRSAFIMLLVGIIYLFFQTNYKKVITFIGIGSIVIFILFANISIEGRNPFRTVSSSERIKSASIAISIFQKSPITGVGFNSYRYAQNYFQFRKPQALVFSNADAGTDNSLLFVLATTGIIGGIIYLRVIREIWENKGDKKNKHYFRAALGGLLVNSLFINSLFYPFVMIWVWMWLSLYNDYGE